VDADRIGPDGAKLRCTKCSAVFLVRAPKAPAVAPVQETPGEQAPAVETAAPATPSEAPAQGPEMDPASLVIVADPDEGRGKESADAIESWGLTPHLVHDGVEAMLSIQRMLPAAVVLDAALPKMFGFQVCEVIKRNESLRHTRVVLVGAIHDQDRYRRDPADLYGADVYIEQPDLPDGLRPILEEAGLPMEDVPGPATTGLSQPPVESAPPTPVAPPPMPEPESNLEESVAPSVPEAVAEPPLSLELETPPVVETPGATLGDSAGEVGAEDPEVAEERERALRLARIAVSEMLLYSPDKFELAIAEGNLEQVLDLEIQEARALLRQRISEEVRAETDFIIDELNRVAAERGEQG